MENLPQVTMTEINKGNNLAGDKRRNGRIYKGETTGVEHEQSGRQRSG